MAAKKIVSKAKAKKSASLRQSPKEVIFKSPNKALAAETAAIELAASIDMTAKPAPEKPMLHAAEELINGQRQADYGDKLRNFTQIAMGFQMVLATKLGPGQQITAFDVGLCMQQVKIARLAKSPEHADSLLDVAGYAGCLDKVKSETQSHVNDFRVNNDALDSAIDNSRLAAALNIKVNGIN